MCDSRHGGRNGSGLQRPSATPTGRRGDHDPESHDHDHDQRDDPRKQPPSPAPLLCLSKEKLSIVAGGLWRCVDHRHDGPGIVVSTGLL